MYLIFRIRQIYLIISLLNNVLLYLTTARFQRDANFETRERLSYLEFCADEQNIRTLEQNKAHGHDKMSVRMIKLCASSISKPLHLNLVIPQRMGKGNIIPLHKKADKQLITNCQPASLLPIDRKVFEKIIF